MISGRLTYFLQRMTKTFTRMLVPGLLFFAAACNNDPEQIKALTGGRGRQEDRAEGVEVIYSKEGKIKMRLFADEFVHNAAAKPSYIDLNSHLKAVFYSDSGEIESILTADSSRYYETEGNVLVWDSVQIVRSKGEQLNTDELVWNNRIEKFFTEKPVRITTPNEVLYGNGMEANRDFTWYQILKPTGTVAVNKNEMPK